MVTRRSTNQLRPLFHPSNEAKTKKIPDKTGMSYHLWEPAALPTRVTMKYVLQFPSPPVTTHLSSANMGEKHMGHMGGLEAVAPPNEPEAAESCSILEVVVSTTVIFSKTFILSSNINLLPFAPNGYWSNKGISLDINTRPILRPRSDPSQKSNMADVQLYRILVLRCLCRFNLANGLGLSSEWT
jgi:hypothetical protein